MIKKYSIILVFLLVTIALFWQFFFKGLYPFPGNLLLGMHEPWRSEYFIDGRITLPNKPVVDDAFKHIYPLRTLSIDIFKKFELPLWNPFNGAGMPLLAGGNNGVLDPFNVLFLFLPYPFAWSIYVILQPLLSGICIYLYCRKISLRPIASLFASITFMLSGFVTVKAIFTIYGLAVATLPLLLYLVESYLQNGITKRTYLIPIFLFTMIVSALPQISLYIIVLTYLYFLFRTIQIKNTFKKKVKQVFPITLLFVLGLGLSSMQLLPTLELFQHASVDTQGSSFIIEKFLVPVQHLLSILIPNYFGNEALYNYWGTADYEQTIVALGLIPCFFAFLGLGRHKKIYRQQPFFIVVAILSAALAVDWVGSRLFFSLPIPIISTSAPSRIFLLTTFAISVLAGFGFDKWLRYENLSKILAIKIFLFLTVIGTIFTITFIYYHNNVICRFGVITNCRIVALRNTILETVVFGITLVPFFTYIFAKTRKIKIISALFIIITVSFIGVYNANKFFPYSPNWSFFPNHPLIEVLQKKARYVRFFGIGDAAFTPNIATQLRLYDPQYFHPLYIQRYRDLLEYANNGKYISNLPRGEPHIRTESNPNPKLEQRRERLLTLLGVSYLIFSKEEIPIAKAQNVIWENNNRYIVHNDKALPRVYLTSKFEVVKSKEEILKNLFDPKFDVKNNVILEETPSFSRFASAVETKDTSLIKRYSENSVIITTNTVSNAILMLSDNFYPGWKAYIDGKETKIYRANYTFRAIEIPQGKHAVIFTYKPKSFYIGASISAIALIILGVIFFVRVKKITPN